jgi:hypothetical protein
MTVRVFLYFAVNVNTVTDQRTSVSSSRCKELLALFVTSLLNMSHASDDDECLSVQLDGNDMCPRAPKVTIHSSPCRCKC